MFERQFFHFVRRLHLYLDKKLRHDYDRSLPFNEELTDRWDRASRLGFGKNTSIYDSSLVFGTPSVGSNCWIGPFTILDGSGGLAIGDFCTISAGVHIYSHDNIQSTLSSRKKQIVRDAVVIGSNVYVGPHAIIAKGVTIGDRVVIAAYSLVTQDVATDSFVAGQPAHYKGPSTRFE